MAERSAIEWTDASWTPIRARREGGGAVKVGWHCEHVSEGCRNCYAENMNRRLGTGVPFQPQQLGQGVEPFLHETMLLSPLRWRKPRMIFVCSMTDLFGRWVEDEWIDRIFAVMALCPQHTFQVLTKRPDRMREYCAGRFGGGFDETISDVMREMGNCISDEDDLQVAADRLDLGRSLPNVWLGTSVEDQVAADARIPLLLDTPAAVRFVSAEPLLGPVDVWRWLSPTFNTCQMEPEAVPRIAAMSRRIVREQDPTAAFLDWVIVGGESGPGARPMHPEWARSIRDQCAAAGVPFFFKQWGEWLTPAGIGEDGPPNVKVSPAWMREDGFVREGPLPYSSEDVPKDGTVARHKWVECARVGKKAAGALLDGREHREWPATEDLSSIAPAGGGGG